MNPAIRTAMTPAEYLAFERASDVKHEYFPGDRDAMTGTFEERRLIAANLIRVLESGLDRELYRIFIPDVPRPDDLEIAVGSAAEPSPVVVIEVAHPIYPHEPRPWRFHDHKRASSLREFARIESDHMGVSEYVRSADNSREWILNDPSEPHDMLVMDSIGVWISLAEIYAGIECRDESSFASIREMAYGTSPIGQSPSQKLFSVSSWRRRVKLLDYLTRP